MKAYLLGRAKRREYWIFVVCMTVACGAANVIIRNPPVVSALSFIPWAVIASRRLRDFGWSPWWCVSTVVGGFLVGFVTQIVNAFTQAANGAPIFTPPMLMVLYGLVSWGVIIFIGSRKSLPAEPRAALVSTFD